VLLTTYLYWGVADDVEFDVGGVVSETSACRIELMMVEFHCSVDG
jgi:hypothetical protein